MAVNKSKKQAVVLVHGIGEQRPMETVREFVKSVWVKDDELENTRFWNKPSEVSGSFEHRRLTTDYAIIKSKNDEPKSNPRKTSRVDFYEYYWAHHTVGTSLEHIKSWLFSVMLRKPSDYPKPLKPLFYLVWALLLVIALVFWIGADANASNEAPGTLFEKLSAFYFSYLKPVVLLVLSILLVKIVSYLGDVARYVTASPSNIKVRQAIRDGGMTLLQSIVATGKYDRIVLVGHSLGSIIAYDVLTQYWAHNNKLKNTAGEALELSKSSLDLIAQMENLDNAEHNQTYRELQQKLFTQLQQDCADRSHSEVKHNPWLISDLVTLGSPLTYADFLLFKSEKEFVERKLDRQFPTCPPVKERQKYTYQASGKYYLHHSAIFSLVKWSNVYSKPFAIFGGDIISGPLGQVFNAPEIRGESTSSALSPIDDRNVKAAFPGPFPRLFTHNNYWKWHKEFETRPPEHLKVLREVLDLKRID